MAVLAILIGYAQELLGEDSFNQVAGFVGRLMPGASFVVVISILVSAASRPCPCSSASLWGTPLELDAVVLKRAPSRALTRRIIVPTLFGLAGWLSWRCSGHGGSPGYVLIRSGALVRKTSITPEASIQHHQLTWSELQKAFRLANVRFHIPGARRRASDLEDDEALSWFQLLGQVEPPGNVP